MKFGDFTQDQLRILGGGLPLGTFNKDDCQLDDSTDQGIENSCTQLVDGGFLTYNGRKEKERFPLGCFKTTQKGWELFLRFRKWKLERISSEDQIKFESTWSKPAEKIVSDLYLREKLEKKLAGITQMRNKLEEKNKKQEEKIKKAWQEFKALWHLTSLQAKLVVLLFFFPILFLIWLVLCFIVAAVLT